MKTLPLYGQAPRSALEQAEAENLDSLCDKCSLSGKVRNACLPADGDAGGLWVVGDSPGEQGDRLGRAMAGSAGQYLRGEVSKHWAGPVIFDNAVRCAPGASKVTTSVVNACRPYSKAIFDEAKPKRIIALGGPACEMLLGRKFHPYSIRRGYGYIGDVPVFLMFHPQGALRNRFLRGWFEADLEWALTCEAPPPPPVTGTVRIIETVEDSVAAAEELRLGMHFDYDMLSVDSETFGAHHDRELEILTVGVVGSGLENPFVWEHDVLSDPAILHPLRVLLEDPEMPLVLQNAKFDLLQLEHGINTLMHSLAADTQLWRRLLQADSINNLATMQVLVGMAGGKDEAADWVKLGCRELAKMIKKPEYRPGFGGLSADKVEAALGRISRGINAKRYAYAYIPPDVRAQYCGRDVVSTGRLQVKFSEEFKALPDSGRADYWEKISLPLVRAMQAIESNGILVDRDAIAHLQRSLMDDIEAQRAALQQYGDVNPNSPASVGELLFDKLKLKVASTTATGKRGTGKEALMNLHHPAADAIITYRSRTKFKTNYADGMEVQIRDDGRIHPSIRIDGTATGRPSCTDPNLMNIPRASSPQGKMCRDVFVAPPGRFILDADYSQIELRVAAMLSQDPVMIGLYKQAGVDFHLETARLIAPLLGVDPSEVDKAHPLRDAAKTINFATLYGEPPVATAAKLKTTVRKAAKMQDAIFGKFQVLKKWIDAQLHEGRLNGAVRTWWDGAVALERPLWMIGDANEKLRSTSEKSTWNTPIQGTATTFTNASLGKIQQELDLYPTTDAKLVMTVYDSIMLEVGKDALQGVAKMVKRIMESWNSDGVPIVVDLKYGTAWGSLEKLVLE